MKSADAAGEGECGALGSACGSWDSPLVLLQGTWLGRVNPHDGPCGQLRVNMRHFIQVMNNQPGPEPAELPAGVFLHTSREADWL